MGRLDGQSRAPSAVSAMPSEHWRRDPGPLRSSPVPPSLLRRSPRSKSRRPKAEERGKAGDAKKLREQAEQWREWAKAAQSAVSDR